MTRVVEMIEDPIVVQGITYHAFKVTVPSWRGWHEMAVRLYNAQLVLSYPREGRIIYGYPIAAQRDEQHERASKDPT